ncbi:hypothetical protein M501DRAFT_933772 [Patellaria atrata CBS 101060]|uniref:Dolichyl-diphosphooligosaccharide-protein glycosyltransferase subunit OST5 n=1 Tax=Patellaria atrata CBS 101060 TaxID=1346257 RepID=A0A9P4VRJ6_9PEZI|nr:hypothetical protein M501DRAFT_933772 [Patellaria atrata CBS 101060]
MSSTPLLDVWEAASGNSYHPTVSKQSQGTTFQYRWSMDLIWCLDRSLVNLPLLGVPASLAFGFGAVYTICAVGVYV